MRKPKILIIGKHIEVKDYVGARTIYLLRTLRDNDVDATPWDIAYKGPEDPIADSTHVVWLNWIQETTDAQLRLAMCLGGSRIMWTESYYWYNEVRAKVRAQHDMDIERSFDKVAFSSNEGFTNWCNSAKYAVWGTLVHEDIVKPREKKRCVFIDQLWPDEWASGIYTIAEIIPEIADRLRKLGYAVATQKREGEQDPAWADEIIGPHIAHDDFIGRLASCSFYVTTHHELLGLQQIEAFMCAMPVVAADEHVCNFARASGAGLFLFNVADKDKAKLPRETILESINAQIDKAIEASSDAEIIRERAIETFGSEAWWKRIGSVELCPPGIKIDRTGL